STVMILVPMRDEQGNVGTATGSGTLIDKKNRIVLTNYHVAGKASQTFVFFPTYRDGKIIAEKEYFLRQTSENPQSVLKGKTLVSDSKIDLALVQLDSLPTDKEVLA